MSELKNFIREFTVKEANNSFSTATFSLSFAHKYLSGTFGRTYSNNPGILVKEFHETLDKEFKHHIHVNPINDTRNGICYLVVTLAFKRERLLNCSYSLINVITRAWKEVIGDTPNSNLNSGVFVFNNINKSEGNYDQQINLIINEHNSLIELFLQEGKMEDNSYINAGW